MENSKIYQGFIGLRIADPRGRNTRWVGPYASIDEVKESLRDSFRAHPNVGIETPGVMLLHGAEYIAYGIATTTDPLTIVEAGTARMCRNDANELSLHFTKDESLEGKV